MKKKKRILTYLVMMVSLSLTSCGWLGLAEEVGEPLFTFINHSNQDLALFYEIPGVPIFTSSFRYPAGSKETFPFHYNKKEAFERYDTIYLYIYNYAEWKESLKTEYHLPDKPLRKDTLTKQWLDEHNWTVTYP
jgi:hypothetical protein